jgi:hypothetical protein
MSGFKQILADLDPRNGGQPALDRVRQIATAEAATVNLLLCDYVDHSTGGVLFDLVRGKPHSGRGRIAWTP